NEGVLQNHGSIGITGLASGNQGTIVNTFTPNVPGGGGFFNLTSTDPANQNDLLDFNHFGSFVNQAVVSTGRNTSFNNNGTFTNSLVASIGSIGNLPIPAVFKNRNILNNQQGATFYSFGSLINLASGTINNSGTLNNSGTFTNAGTVNIS